MMSPSKALFEQMRVIEAAVREHRNSLVDRAILFYLLTRMDESSGTVGLASAVSKGRCALDVDEKGGAGNRGDRKKLVSVSADDVKHCVERYVKSGLLVRKSQGKRFAVQFVFWADYLSQDKSAQKEVARILPSSCLEENDIKQGGYGDNGDVGCPKVAPSLITTTTTTTTGIEKFAMGEGWLPSESFPDLAAMSGFDVREGGSDRELMNTAIVDMRLYRMDERPNERKSQHGWHHVLLKTMRFLKTAVAAKKSGAGVGSGGGKAAIDAVPRANNQEGLYAFQRKYAGMGAPMAGQYQGFEQWAQTLQQWRAEVLAKRKQGDCA